MSGRQGGFAVMLVEEEKIQELIARYAQDDELMVNISARGEVIATNATAEMSLQRDEASSYLATLHVGLTPFSIEVWADKNAPNINSVTFSLASAVTALAFIILLILFTQLLNRRFLSPMLRVMENVEQLPTTSEGSPLSPVGSEEFDRLIQKINEMLLKLSDNNQQLAAAELRVKNSEIEKQKAVIFSLKKQINAHFTINTLVTVQILTAQGNIVAAADILNKLSALIRYAYADDELISVLDEFQMLEHYVDVMNIRHGDKISAAYDMDDRLMDVKIPRMLLQPLVENAITHGFKDRAKNCVLTVRAALTQEGMTLCVCDNGTSMSSKRRVELAAKLEKESEGAPQGIQNIALVNVRRRLTAYYGGNAAITITSKPGEGTEVRIALPTEARKDI
jgi:two-component system sensor histidine kinase YesM